MEEVEVASSICSGCDDCTDDCTDDCSGDSLRLHASSTWHRGAGHTMQQPEPDNTSGGDEQVAKLAALLYEQEIEVCVDDMCSALKQCSQDPGKAAAKIRTWVSQGKPKGKFCEVSAEELAWLLLQEVGVSLSSFNLAVRLFTPEKLQGSYGAVATIAQIFDLLPEMPQPEEDPAVLPDLTQLTRNDLCHILKLVGVKKPQGRKDVYVKTVAELFAQSSGTCSSGSGSGSGSGRAAEAEIEEANMVSVAAEPDCTDRQQSNEGEVRLNRRALGKKEGTRRCHKWRKIMRLSMYMGMRSAISMVACMHRRQPAHALKV